MQAHPPCTAAIRERVAPNVRGAGPSTTSLLAAQRSLRVESKSSEMRYQEKRRQRLEGESCVFGRSTERSSISAVGQPTPVDRRVVGTFAVFTPSGLGLEFTNISILRQDASARHQHPPRPFPACSQVPRRVYVRRQHGSSSPLCPFASTVPRLFLNIEEVMGHARTG